MTVDAIFDAVRHELGKGVGLDRVGMTDELVAGLAYRGAAVRCAGAEGTGLGRGDQRESALTVY